MKRSDVFFVESGLATLVVGGTLKGGETTAPHEKRNGTIEGGTRQKLSRGMLCGFPRTCRINCYWMEEGVYVLVIKN